MYWTQCGWLRWGYPWKRGADSYLQRYTRTISKRYIMYSYICTNIIYGRICEKYFLKEHTYCVGCGQCVYELSIYDDAAANLLVYVCLRCAVEVTSTREFTRWPLDLHKVQFIFKIKSVWWWYFILIIVVVLKLKLNYHVWITQWRKVFGVQNNYSRTILILALRLKYFSWNICRS